VNVKLPTDDSRTARAGAGRAKKGCEVEIRERKDDEEDEGASARKEGRGMRWW
jgi:hypothetical protein